MFANPKTSALFVATSAALALLLPSRSSATSPTRPQSHRLSPDAIAFWTSQRGLIGSGSTSGANGAVSLTTDGGRTYRVVLRTSGPVEWVATAGPKSAWALVEHCTPTRCRRAALETSTDGGRTWRRLDEAPSWNPAFANTTLGLALNAVNPGRGTQALAPSHNLLMTSDGGRSWTHTSSPCPGASGIALAFPEPPLAIAACAGPGHAEDQAKALFESIDAGRSWHHVLTVDDHNRPSEVSHGLSLHGLIQGMSFGPQGSGLLLVSRGPVYFTTDRGRDWRPLPAITPTAGTPRSAAVVSTTTAFLLVRRAGGQVSLIRTHDSGQTWAVVSRW